MNDAPNANRRSSPSPRQQGEAGFTLAAVIVILTILALLVAYTVPTQWSKVMQREREKQTIFAMKQYARAIKEWSKAHGGNPTKLEQLKEARLPRVVRGKAGELIDPLTGKVDWILVPPTAVTGANTPGSIAGGLPNGGGTSTTDTTGTSTSTSTTATTSTTGTGTPTSPTATDTSATSGFNAAASPKDYAGPFVGVRPPISGTAILTLNGASTYDQWHYTTFDLDKEIALATMPNPNAH